MSKDASQEQVPLFDAKPEFDLDSYIDGVVRANADRPKVEPDTEALERRAEVLQDAAGFTVHMAEVETSEYIPKEPPSPGRKRERRIDRKPHPPLKPREREVADRRPDLKPSVPRFEPLTSAPASTLAKEAAPGPAPRDPEDTLRAFD